MQTRDDRLDLNLHKRLARQGRKRPVKARVHMDNFVHVPMKIFAAHLHKGFKQDNTCPPDFPHKELARMPNMCFCDQSKLDKSVH